MFWFYVPLLINTLTVLFYLLLGSNQDRSGAGMVGFFLMVPLIILNLTAWTVYFAAGMIFGIK